MNGFHIEFTWKLLLPPCFINLSVFKSSMSLKHSEQEVPKSSSKICISTTTPSLHPKRSDRDPVSISCGLAWSIECRWNLCRHPIPPKSNGFPQSRWNINTFQNQKSGKSGKSGGKKHFTEQKQLFWSKHLAMFIDRPAGGSLLWTSQLSWEILRWNGQKR